jgi:transporter family protein
MNLFENGTFFIVLTIILWGITPILDKLGSSGNDALVSVFVRGTAVGLTAFLMVLATGKTPLLAQLSSKAILLLSLSGILAGCLGVFTYFRALQLTHDAGKVSVLSSTYPLIAMLLGFLLLGEKLTGTKIAGSVLITLGIILLNR